MVSVELQRRQPLRQIGIGEGEIKTTTVNKTTSPKRATRQRPLCACVGASSLHLASVDVHEQEHQVGLPLSSSPGAAVCRVVFLPLLGGGLGGCRCARALSSLGANTFSLLA